MKILALDCANDNCSAALFRDGAVVGRDFRQLSRGQAEVLMGLIDGVLRQAREEYAALDAIGVTVGPGSFTGVRIGLATARGLGLAANLPVVGVSALNVAGHLAASLHPDKKVCIFFDTKRSDYYAQLFFNGTPCGEPFAGGAEVLTALNADVYAGNCPDMFFEQTGKKADLLKMPDASDVALFIAAKHRSEIRKKPPYEYPSALYLREAEISTCAK